MEGLGNDFVVIPGPAAPTPAEIATWCDRRRGIGADGVLEVTRRDGTAVAMRYWNADGGAAEMCGNGLRCVARYAYERGWVDGRSFSVETEIGRLPVTVNEDGTVRAFLGVPSAGKLDLDGTTLDVADMGNPHAVLWVDDVAAAPVAEIGPQLETAAPFPMGTNVEFAAVTGEDQIELRVWERGVGETLACGTGAAATAYVAHQQGKVGPSTVMQLQGGDLRVEFDEAGAWIEGPANSVFAGEI